MKKGNFFLKKKEHQCKVGSRKSSQMFKSVPAMVWGIAEWKGGFPRFATPPLSASSAALGPTARCSAPRARPRLIRPGLSAAANTPPPPRNLSAASSSALSLSSSRAPGNPRPGPARQSRRGDTSAKLPHPRHRDPATARIAPQCAAWREPYQEVAAGSALAAWLEKGAGRAVGGRHFRHARLPARPKCSPRAASPGWPLRAGRPKDAISARQCHWRCHLPPALAGRRPLEVPCPRRHGKVAGRHISPVRPARSALVTSRQRERPRNSG